MAGWPSQIWCDNDSSAQCNAFDGLEPTPNTTRRGTPLDAIVHDCERSFPFGVCFHLVFDVLFSQFPHGRVVKLMKTWFPNAKIKASTFDAYYDDLAASKAATLPTFTGEVGGASQFIDDCVTVS
eukprot:SAG11_NODE_2836_length_2921_cov_1.357193_2_plen_125_part_00